MSTLRWIILIVGALVLAGIWLHWRFLGPGAASGQDASRSPDEGETEPHERYEPTVGGHPFDALGDVQDDGSTPPLYADDGPEEAFPVADEAVTQPPDAPATQPAGAPDRAGSDPAEPEPAPGADRGNIVVLHVAAPEGGMFHAEDVVRALVREGLSHGTGGAFYRYPEEGRQRGFVFCAANMLEPGSFDLREMEHMRTPGVALMTMLPGPVPARDAVDAMVDTALTLAKSLGGRLLDEQRRPVTEANLGQLFERALAAERTAR
ncbi:MAG TPA: cell division protein ZipA C-terminal FtsZ-binding domain-containing protein [Gammaproteobacteria bacterium]|nr:cell division protein ZipA C-terminal FtsZ-binding domain-containing protein [Gammaproteobacteria bacterium]